MPEGIYENIIWESWYLYRTSNGSLQYTDLDISRYITLNDWLADCFEADLFQSCQMLTNRAFKYKIETARSSDGTHKMSPVALNSPFINITIIISSSINITSLSSLSSSFYCFSSSSSSSSYGRAIAQAVIRRSLTLEARILFQANIWDFWWTKCHWDRFVFGYSIFPCHQSTVAPYSFIHQTLTVCNLTNWQLC